MLNVFIIIYAHEFSHTCFNVSIYSSYKGSTSVSSTAP
ncbi:hypothetical protein NHE_0131 [Neorickettsia helminthoeca str. Oregon]|uniref:Uncharacterized protein n=1 Tax=Neorickettsia helminthoeca str. Oregon TaxID=1286528 RepID=X5HL68_9RICK|nr:hypothetical protein NHE_0131 [Neorickettsia helminthoeca str. Oregon]